MSNLFDSKMSIFISSPDSYKDVLCVFLECIKRYWKDCRYEIVISTNTNQYEGVTIYRNNLINDGWTERALFALKQMDCEYVLLMCDDCIITEEIDSDRIERILTDIVEYNIDFCGFTNKIPGKRVTANSDVGLVKKNKAYALNLQTGIFKREYLLQLLGDGTSSPWDLEKKWLQEAIQADDSYFENIASVQNDVLHCKNGVLKGKWYFSVKKELESKGIKIESDRETISKNEERKLVISSRIGKMIPVGLRPIIKRVLSVFGKKFATEY